MESSKRAQRCGVRSRADERGTIQSSVAVSRRVLRTAAVRTIAANGLWPRLPSGGYTHPVRDDSQHQAEAVYRNRIRPLDVLLQPRRSQERSRRPSTRHYVHRTQPVRPAVHRTWNSVDQKKVQDVDLTTFQKLERDDVLFIDSSHVLKIDGDPLSVSGSAAIVERGHGRPHTRCAVSVQHSLSAGFVGVSSLAGVVERSDGGAIVLVFQRQIQNNDVDTLDSTLRRSFSEGADTDLPVRCRKPQHVQLPVAPPCFIAHRSFRNPADFLCRPLKTDIKRLDRYVVHYTREMTTQGIAEAALVQRKYRLEGFSRAIGS